MAIHKTVSRPGIYFISFTCHGWIPLIDTTNGYDLVYKWFDFISKKGHSVNAYVIMPNHLHMLMHYTGIGHSLNTVVGNGKRFMAYGMIDRLENNNNKRLLSRLGDAVSPVLRKSRHKHRFWIDSFDVKECFTEKFLLQKLNYIHNNPCSGKWRLAGSIIDYCHSSASFYITGKHAGYVVKDYRSFL